MERSLSFLLILLAFLSVVACGEVQPSPTPQSQLVETFTPSLASAPTADSRATSTTLPKPTPTPPPTAAPASPTNTSTSVPTTTPSPTTVASSVPSTGYDGSWLGTTDQGEYIEFEIKEGGVRSISIGFSIPGCEGDSPMGAYYGTPEHFITDNSLTLTVTGIYIINVNGTFTSESSISGTLNITSSNPCGQGLSTNWSAVPAEVFEPPPAPSELLARLPGVSIPDDLFLPEDGDRNFHEFTRVIDSSGDWFLVSVFDSVFPVPSGWTIFGTGQEDAILVFSRGGVELIREHNEGITFEPEPEIVIVIGAGIVDYQTSEETISVIEDQFSDWPDSVVKREMVDAGRGYILLQSLIERGIKRYVFILVSQLPDGSLRSIRVVADGQDWYDYYPILQAIVENWALSWDNSTLGVALPTLEELRPDLERPATLPTPKPTPTSTVTPLPTATPAPLSTPLPIHILSSWGSAGGGDGQFGNLNMDIAVDGLGNVYVADTANNRVQVFNAKGEFLRKWSTGGIYTGGIAVDDSGNVYVTSYHQVEVFSPGGELLRMWGSFGTDDGQFMFSGKIALDSLGNVYVVDNNRVQVFSESGEFLRKWGSEGDGDGQFRDPAGIAVDGSGNVYVTDSFNDRVQIFSSDGEFLRKWGSSGSGGGQFYLPHGIAIDGSGNVYVTDTNNDRVQVFGSNGEFLGYWGSGGNGAGQFDGPSGIAVDESGNIYVTESKFDNSRVQVFQVELSSP